MIQKKFIIMGSYNSTLDIIDKIFFTFSSMKLRLIR